MSIFAQNNLLNDEFRLRFIKEQLISIQKNSGFANLNKQLFIGLYLNIYFFIVFLQTYSYFQILYATLS